MLSAAIAGLGGALMSAQLGSVNQESVRHLPEPRVADAHRRRGIGYVSGGLMGGILAGAAFVAIQDTLTKLGTDTRRSTACSAGWPTSRSSCPP